MANKKVRQNVKTATGFDTVFPETLGEQVYLDGYTKPTTGGLIAAGDNVNQALGKLEKNIEGIVVDKGLVKSVCGVSANAAGDVALGATDVGAAASGHKHVKADVTDFAHKATHKTGGSDALSAADVGAFPATGGILDAHLTVNGFFSARTGMEVYGGTPFIDFHHNNSSADYTTRIIENTAGKLSISGSLEVAGEISVGRINMWSAYNAGIMQAYVGQCFRINNLTNTGFMPCEASGFFVNSSLRYKNILEGLSEEEALKILRVDAVRYQYKKERIDDGGKVHSGVIAEQVDEIGITDVITYDDQGRPDSVDYSKFVPYLIKLAQVQQEEIDRLRSRLDELELGL